MGVMTMATARNGDIAIHYEVTGDGPSLVLLHGFMGSSAAWHLAGFVDALAGEFRMILVDARGHGGSDKPHDPGAYRVRHDVADVAAVLDDIGIRSVATCGWSMGGVTALAMAALDPARVHAIAVFGTNASVLAFPDVKPPEPDRNAPIVELFETQSMEWIARILDDEGRPAWASLLREGDPQAMAARLRGESYLDPLPVRLQDLTLPILAVWGEHDVPSAPHHLPEHATVIVIPGEDHLGSLTRTDMTIPALRSLLETEPPAT